MTHHQLLLGFFTGALPFLRTSQSHSAAPCSRPWQQAQSGAPTSPPPPRAPRRRPAPPAAAAPAPVHFPAILPKLLTTAAFIAAPLFAAQVVGAACFFDIKARRRL